MDPWKVLASLGTRHCSFDDPLFRSGNNICQPLKKLSILPSEDSYLQNDDSLQCMACQEEFGNLTDLAAHQRRCHEPVCATCGRSFPSHHLLELHVLESHDSLFQLQAQKQPLYQCFLESCKHHFSSPLERKQHCITTHKFPSDYRFDLSWRKKSGKQKEKVNPMHVDSSSHAGNISPSGSFSAEMECESVSMDPSKLLDKHVDTECKYGDKIGSDRCQRDSSLNVKNTTTRKAKYKYKVPPNISFGMSVPKGFHRAGQHGHNRKAHSKHKTIEDISMTDLADALSSSCDGS